MNCLFCEYLFPLLCYLGLSSPPSDLPCTAVGGGSCPDEGIMDRVRWFCPLWMSLSVQLGFHLRRSSLMKVLNGFLLLHEDLAPGDSFRTEFEYHLITQTFSCYVLLGCGTMMATPITPSSKKELLKRITHHSFALSSNVGSGRTLQFWLSGPVNGADLSGIFEIDSQRFE